MSGTHFAKRVARVDRALTATLVSRRPLHYDLGADPALDRPAHVRAASSATWIDGFIGLVQDDANFVALVHPDNGAVHAIALPAGDGGIRQFDDARGNKRDKLDLEACVAIGEHASSRLLAFGSGSKKRRRRIAMVEGLRDAVPRATLHDASTLYLRLEDEAAFAGSDLNIEGVLAVRDRLRLFGRGNGKAKGGRLPLNATCDIMLDALLHYLDDPARQPPPDPEAVVQFDLGAIDGVALGFTDATTFSDHVLFAAAAEASEDASVDGPVGGSALGVITTGGVVRYAPLLDLDGAPLTDKVEGVVRSRTSDHRVYVVIDADDASRPSELCEVELRGSWMD